MPQKPRTRLRDLLQKTKLKAESQVSFPKPNKIGGQARFAKFQEFVAENGDTLVPQSHFTSDEYYLGRWMGKQRRKFKNGKLNDNQDNLLK